MEHPVEESIQNWALLSLKVQIGNQNVYKKAYLNARNCVRNKVN